MFLSTSKPAQRLLAPPQLAPIFSFDHQELRRSRLVGNPGENRKQRTRRVKEERQRRTVKKAEGDD
jgi:hypothetical protein